MKKNNPDKCAFSQKAALFFQVLLIALLLFLFFGCKRSTTVPAPENSPSDEGKTEQVAEYTPAEVFGAITEYSTFAPGETLDDSFYYSDAWFDKAPQERNDALALLSMQLSAAAATKDENGHGANALRAIGFDKIGFEGFETDDPDDCAYTWATKEIGDCRLVVIVVQSYALDAQTKTKGWKQNFTVNGESTTGEHAAFATAAGKVLDKIAGLGGAKAKYWITGQSRGGALANLIAAKLPEKLGASNQGVYAYTFESPATVDASFAESGSGKYAYIHNYIANDDIVTMIPAWGMTRYGKDYELKSEATESALKAELAKIGSKAAEADHNSRAELATELVRFLEARIAAGAPINGGRANYSVIRRDAFKDAEENDAVIEYSYQDTLVHLMGMIFSGELSGIEIDELTDKLPELTGFASLLATAVREENAGSAEAAVPHYRQSAQELRRVLNEVVKREISLSETDFYALLRLFGPRLIDLDYTPEDDEPASVFSYLLPVFDIAVSAGDLTYSHHFDTVIARLKTRAPQPTQPSFEVVVTSPKSGDAASKMVNEFADQIAKRNENWLSVQSAAWNTDRQDLQSGSLYYFEAKLKVVGHLVPEFFIVRINGKAPVDISVAYEKGIPVACLTWEFAVGTPEETSLFFDTGNGAEAPETLRLSMGKRLKYVEKPAFAEKFFEEGETLFFRDWQDGDGNFWDDVTVSGETRLFAKWIRVIDNVQLSFVLPSVGEQIQSPFLPEGVLYRVSEFHVNDENYRTVEEITCAGEYELIVFLVAVPGESVFAETVDNFDERVYAGSVALNGKESQSFWYEPYEDPALLVMTESFTVTA